MPKYIDPGGVAYLWSKIKKINANNLIYYSKTTAEWNDDITFLSEPNVLYIYTDYKTIEKEDGETILYPGLKLGDGTTYLIDLPFLNSKEMDDLFLDHINNRIIHITAE